MELIINSPTNPICCNLFNLPIRWYGILICLAIFTGVLCVYFLTKTKYAKQFADELIDFAPSLIFTSIIGARLFYVIGDWKFYCDNLKEIVFINHGGLSIYGAITFGIIYILVYSYKNKINPLKYFDIIAIAMPLSQAIGRWGNFFNQEAYGLPSNSFFKLYIDPKNRLPQYLDQDFYHPTFLYESIFDLALFFVLLCIFLKYKSIKTGVIASAYLLAYSIIRFFVEQIRIDSVCDIYGLHIAQIISIMFVIVALIILFYANKKGG